MEAEQLGFEIMRESEMGKAEGITPYQIAAVYLGVRQHVDGKTEILLNAGWYHQILSAFFEAAALAGLSKEHVVEQLNKELDRLRDVLQKILANPEVMAAVDAKVESSN